MVGKSTCYTHEASGGVDSSTGFLFDFLLGILASRTTVSFRLSRAGIPKDCPSSMLTVSMWGPDAMSEDMDSRALALAIILLLLDLLRDELLFFSREERLDADKKSNERSLIS